MAHMMLFYELMRVKREYNAESRRQISISQQMDRMKRQIDTTTKRYTSLFSQLESQAKYMQNNANMYFQSMTGGYDFNCMNVQSMCGVPQYFINQVFAKGDFQSYSYDAKEKKYVQNPNLSHGEYNRLLDIYNTRGGFQEKNEEGKTVNIEGIDNWQISAFNQVQQAASQMQNQIKMAVSQMSNMFQNNVTSWLECQKAALTAEQESALDALNYEETMLECDQTASKVRCEELKAEKESLQQELSERVKDDAPGFGL